VNKTTKWIVFGLVGALALGVAAWGWAGPAPQGNNEGGYMMDGNGQMGDHGMGMMGMGMMGAHMSGSSQQMGQWCAQMGDQMQSSMEMPSSQTPTQGETSDVEP